MNSVPERRRPVTADLDVDEDSVDRVRHRLFPDRPDGFEPRPTFLCVTGRGDLPGHARRQSWRWYSEPVA